MNVQIYYINGNMAYIGYRCKYDRYTTYITLVDIAKAIYYMKLLSYRYTAVSNIDKIGC